VVRQLAEINAEETAMHFTTLHDLFLIPVGLAVAFLLWFLWSVTKQLSHHGDSIAKQPVISIQASDRYTIRGLPERPETVSRPSRILNPEKSYGSSPAREYVPMHTAPKLGMRTSIPSLRF
jgi:hypothetical protein